MDKSEVEANHDADIKEMRELHIAKASVSLDTVRKIYTHLNVTDGPMLTALGEAYTHFNMMKDDPEKITVENASVMNAMLEEMIDMIKDRVAKEAMK